MYFFAVRSLISISRINTSHSSWYESLILARNADLTTAKSSSLRRKYSGEDFRKHFKKSVSIVASISYDTFVLYLHVFSEYVRRVPKRPKYSPTVTIWLQKDEPNKNCNQEYVQRLFRVLICCCYSNDYVELCSGIYGSSFHPFRR